MRILLQFPEGLKQKALEYSSKYQDEGHEVFISSTPCFGACGVAINEAQMIKADKIIHFGHSKFVKRDLPVPVEYINFKIDIDIKELKHLMLELGEFKKIALATTVQHVHQLDEIKEFFLDNGIEILTGMGKIANNEAQILGCDAAAVESIEKDADAILYIGGGNFHPLAIDADKPVFTYNPYSNVLRKINDEIKKLRKRRKGMLAAAIVSKVFAILVSTKVGQFNLGFAQLMKKKLEEKGKRAEILIANTFDPISLENFLAFDCYITTACPRISDDSDAYNGKPILDIELCGELLKLL